MEQDTNITTNRHKYIGGSDLPNILGYNLKYGTTPYLWARQKAKLDPNDFKGNMYTRYGHLMEPTIRDYINEIQGTDFIEATKVIEVLKLRGNTDGIDRENNLILEVKTHGVEFDREQYYPQIQFYMEVFNIDQCWLVGYERPEHFYTGVDLEIDSEKEFFDLTFDPERITIEVVERDKDFWNTIYDRILAFQKGTALLLNAEYPTEDIFNRAFYGNDLIVTTNKINRLEKKIATMKDTEKELKEEKEKLYRLFEDRGIKKFTNDLMTITKVDPTTSTRTTIDPKKLEKAHPRIYAKMKEEKTTNRKGHLRITLKDKKEEENK